MLKHILYKSAEPLILFPAKNLRDKTARPQEMPSVGFLHIGKFALPLLQAGQPQIRL